MTTSLRARKAGVAIDLAHREKDDFYPTPPEATRALLTVEKFTGAIWEPCCGDGAISRVLLAAGHEVVSTALVDRGYGQGRVDFLLEWLALAPNIITNPPFKLVSNEAPFLRHALELASGKVAFFMRVGCLAGGGRRKIYKWRPISRVWIFPKRLAMRRAGYNGSASGLLDFAWFVWDSAHVGASELHWLDPVTAYDPVADSLGSWHDGIAELRLRNGDAR